MAERHGKTSPAAQEAREALAAWPGGRLQAEHVVVGSGPGGAITAMCLAEAGCDVLLLEEGPRLGLDSAPHFSREEASQKYRNGGVTVSGGKSKLTYVEGRCVGGGSEVNRGLYHRIPGRVLAAWERDYGLADCSEAAMERHFEACEAITRVAPLPGPAPRLSQKLGEGAARLGWHSVEVPRLMQYAESGDTKQSMTECVIPRITAAGGRLLPGVRVERLRRRRGRWVLEARWQGPSGASGRLKIEARTLFVAGGAVQTPMLLRRSGFRRNIGNSLRVHPMIKVVARFAEAVNVPGQLDPVHQVDEFYPTFSLGASLSMRPILALTMMEHPEYLDEVAEHWQHMAVYYAQTCGGSGRVRALPGFKDPLVSLRYSEAELADISSGLEHLIRCLLAAGAEAVFPAVRESPVIRDTSQLEEFPGRLSAANANLSTLHMFSSCPMGENKARCAVDSYGKLFDADDLYIADASLLCGPTEVNPQGTVMAFARRNVMHYLAQR